ncbi:hypothetical protein MUK51_19570 [Sphingobacterium faecium]|uniref:TlpA family protein disulfide reductase n=1 Tax=Sphingobacterium faecium TaxID=34087 RepID=UPI0021B6B1AE|nr:hypothetical protein [Sphingobacterium faecium]UXD69364.1 hypothetical protein MUK51_19570 [Sphingobacterium faecium]
MLKKSKGERYALSPKEEMFSDNELSVGLSTKTDKNINILENFVTQGDRDIFQSQSSSFNKQLHNLGTIYWLICPALHSLNLIVCSWRAIKEIALPVIMVIGMLNMFSLSAQTPRKDSGADGKSTPWTVGHFLPEEFWDKEHLIIINGDTVRRTLQQHRGKVLVLDFWYIGCSACLRHQESITKAKEKYKDQLDVVMVNNLPKWNKLEDLQKFYRTKKYIDYGMHDFQSIIADDYLYNGFASLGYPLYIWITPAGRVGLITNLNLLDQDVIPFIERSGNND